jgi:hypothetical protein
LTNSSTDFGVQAAPIHELNIAGYREVYSDIFPETSAIWIYVKDSSESEAVITLDDITPEATEEKQEKMNRQQTATN